VAARAASEQRLRQFVADASHELRTPLTSIRGFAELYRRGGAPPGPLLDETMSRIEDEAARMGLLVDELILLARLDRQRPLERRRVDLLAIAADTVRGAHAQAPGRRLNLAALNEMFEPVTVLGDEHRLRQVASNLAGNAIQHTPPEAGVTVRVGRRAAGPAEVAVPGWAPGTSAAILEVADTGPGIPAEHAERVFERLYRVDLSRSRHDGGGSGLGLSIVTAIVDAHGGRVELETAPGRGCVFRVLLPEAPPR
jgi:two-component system OmpR family sensor kinase